MNPERKRLEVVNNGQVFALSFATLAELEEAKSVDDNAFGNHHGITMDELMQIHEHGKIILMREKATGRLIGEAQILFRKIPDLPCELDCDIAYCYGIGVHPEFQGRGLGKVIMGFHDDCAHAVGCREIRLTVRIENYPSIKLMMGTGYHIYEYDQSFYGPAVETDSRILMRRHLNGAQARLAPVSLRDPSFVPVTFGDAYDAEAHKLVSSFLEEGLSGRRIDRQGLYFYKN